MNAAQTAAFQANSGITPSDVSIVLIGAVFAVLLTKFQFASKVVVVTPSKLV